MSRILRRELRLGSLNPWRIGDISECDALAIGGGVPDRHVQKHRVLVEGHEGGNDQVRLIVLDGSDKARHFVLQSLLSHFGKLFHSWTVSRNRVRRKLVLELGSP